MRALLGGNGSRHSAAGRASVQRGGQLALGRGEASARSAVGPAVLGVRVLGGGVLLGKLGMLVLV